MNKRQAFLVSITLMCFLVVALIPMLLTWLFFQAYRATGLGLTFLLIGGMSFFLGSREHRMTRKSGVSLPWWKHYPTVMALFIGCIGVILVILSTPISLQVNDSIAFSFVLLALGLGIYAGVLAVQQLKRAIEQRQ